MQKNKLEFLKNIGDKAELVSVNCLSKLQDELNDFQSKNELNHFQKWIVETMYTLQVPDAEFNVTSILLVAVPHASYCPVNFTYEGKTHKIQNPAVANLVTEKSKITDYLSNEGYHFLEAPSLPLKRLSAKTGLSNYGRNNICYIDGFGSFFSLLGFFTDIPCEHYTWTALELNENCKNCSACISSCPTGAILPERFLIDNTKCLSFFNESPDEMPEWIPKEAHHTMYDCLKCQKICPMNQDALKNTGETIELSENEVSLFLTSESYDSLPKALKEKLKPLGLNTWFEAVKRNIRLLAET